MSLTTVCVSPPWWQKLLVVFFFFWPFITVMLLRRGRSPMPLLAMLLPFALANAGTWLGLARVIRGHARARDRRADGVPSTPVQ